MGGGWGLDVVGLWALSLSGPWANPPPCIGPDSLLTKCGNLAAKLGGKHNLLATLGSSLAKVRAEDALETGFGRFLPRTLAAVVLTALVVLPIVQAEKWTGHWCQGKEQEHFQLTDE